MSDLENESKPIIGPMVSGRGTFLDEFEQSIVARWIFLRALILTLTSTGHQIPDEDYKAFYDRREPPATATVLASVYMGLEHATFFHMQPFTLSREGEPRSGPANSYMATLAVGHFVGQVFGTSVDTGDPGTGIGFTVSGRLATSVRRIRPFQSAFIWPPGAFLDEGGLAMVAGTENPTT